MDMGGSLVIKRIVMLNMPTTIRTLTMMSLNLQAWRFLIGRCEPQIPSRTKGQKRPFDLVLWRAKRMFRLNHIALA
ncbi:hypothetical protein D3C85_1403000 [compost metagenome]